MFKVLQGLRGRSVLALGVGNCPVVQWLGLYACTAGGTGLIPGPGTEISQAYAVWYSPKKKKKKNYMPAGNQENPGKGWLL